jgi:hypothetical protein
MNTAEMEQRPMHAVWHRRKTAAVLVAVTFPITPLSARASLKTRDVIGQEMRNKQGSERNRFNKHGTQRQWYRNRVDHQSFAWYIAQGPMMISPFFMIF